MDLSVNMNSRDFGFTNLFDFKAKVIQSYLFKYILRFL
jgi:hypothetical protein